MVTLKVSETEGKLNSLITGCFNFMLVFSEVSLMKLYDLFGNLGIMMIKNEICLGFKTLGLFGR